MKFKKVLAVAMAMTLMVSGLAGCQKKDDADSNTNTDKSNSATTDEVETITYMFPIFANTPKDLSKVQDEINKISEKEAGVSVVLKPVSVASYANELSLAITGGEELDLALAIPMGSATFKTMVSQNQVMDVTDLLNSDGQGIKEALGDEFIAGTTVNGKIYGVTPLYGKSTKNYVAMRADLLEKYNLTEKADNAKTMSDLEAIWTEMYKNEPNMSMIVPSSNGNIINLSGCYFDGDTFTDMIAFDSLGDSTNLLGVANYSDPSKVVSYYESDLVKKSYEKTHEWYQKGWIYKDAATTTDTCQELVKQGNAFSYFFQGEADANTAQKNATGYDMKLIEINTNPVETSSITKFVWTIPTTSKHAQAAMKFLNLTYTNADIINLINYGIEGVHYKTNADKTITYADGVDATNTGWGLTSSFLFGNQYLAKVWEGEDLKIRETTKEWNDSAEMSPLLGFSFDSTPVSDQLAAMTNVIAQYRPALQSGISDISTLDQFVSDLKAAGLQDYLDQMQTQLDEFNKSK